MIIIAHASQDNWYANYIFDGTAFNGIKVWVDHYNTQNGVVIGDDLERALQDSTMMILVCSQYSMNSPLITMQWQRFCSEGKPIISVVVDPQCRIPFELRNSPILDFTNQVAMTNNFPYLTELVQYHWETEQHYRQQNLRTDLDDLHRRATQIWEEQAPTYRAGTIQFVLPYHNQILTCPVTPKLLLGRQQTAQQARMPVLNLPNSRQLISRKHAMLTYINGTLFIRDTESSNGTYINNRRLTQNKDYIVPNYSVIHFSSELPTVIRHQP